MNTDGTLTGADKDRFIKWLKEHEKPGETPFCPFCHSNKWMVGDHIIDNPVRIPGQVILGGTVYPHVLLICSHCAFTMLFNAVIAGVLSVDEGEKEKADAAPDAKEAAQ